jgi:hypothetical protein
MTDPLPCIALNCPLEHHAITQCKAERCAYLYLRERRERQEEDREEREAKG